MDLYVLVSLRNYSNAENMAMFQAIMRQCPALDGLSNEHLNALFPRATFAKVNAGEIVFAAGSPVSKAVFVASGSLLNVALRERSRLLTPRLTPRAQAEAGSLPVARPGSARRPRTPLSTVAPPPSDGSSILVDHSPSSKPESLDSELMDLSVPKTLEKGGYFGISVLHGDKMMVRSSRIAFDPCNRISRDDKPCVLLLMCAPIGAYQHSNCRPG